VLMWVVVGPADTKLAPGLLEQSYVGSHSPPDEAEWEPPIMLVGEQNDDFALRPMTDSFATRDDAEDAGSSVTVVVLKVKSAPA